MPANVAARNRPGQSAAKMVVVVAAAAPPRHCSSRVQDPASSQITSGPARTRNRSCRAACAVAWAGAMRAGLSRLPFWRLKLPMAITKWCQRVRRSSSSGAIHTRSASHEMSSHSPPSDQALPNARILSAGTPSMSISLDTSSGIVRVTVAPPGLYRLAARTVSCLMSD